MTIMAPGKTAPRLLEDLLSYDPRTASRETNVLADPAPILEDVQQYVPRVPKNSCRHSYAINHLQSVIPLLDDRPTHNSKCQIASVCQNCRCHLTVTISFGRSSWNASPCPIPERPLHFFVLKSRRETQDPWVAEDLNFRDREREYCFECTAPNCRAALRISLSPPRLTSGQISLLTDPHRLRSRYDAATAADPSRTFEEPNSALVLHRLRTYLRDGLDTTSPRSQFPKKNRAFMVTFGEDCDKFLRLLGFSDAVDTEEDPGWRIPRPPPKSDTFDQTSHRAFLEDVMEELAMLILNKPTSEKQSIKSFMYQPVSARRELERALGMLDCESSESLTIEMALIYTCVDDKALSARRYDPNVPEHP